MFLICPNFLWFPAMKDVPAVNWLGLLTFTLFWRVLIVFPLRDINKLIKLSLFEQVTGDEFAKIRRQYLAFTLDKRNHSGELTGISNYRFDVVQHTNVDFFPNLSLSIIVLSFVNLQIYHSEKWIVAHLNINACFI